MSEPSRSHITCLPVVPAAWSCRLRAPGDSLARPATVAVGLWRGLETEYLSAVARLPELSPFPGAGPIRCRARRRTRTTCSSSPAIRSSRPSGDGRQIGAEVLFLLTKPSSRPASRVGFRRAFWSPCRPYAAARLGLPAYLRTVLQSSPASEADSRAVEAMAALAGRRPGREDVAFVAPSALAPLLQALNRPRSGQDWAGTGCARVRRRACHEVRGRCLEPPSGLPGRGVQHASVLRRALRALARDADQPPPTAASATRLLREAEFNYQVQTTATLRIGSAARWPASPQTG